MSPSLRPGPVPSPRSRRTPDRSPPRPAASPPPPAPGRPRRRQPHRPHHRRHLPVPLRHRGHRPLPPRRRAMRRAMAVLHPLSSTNTNRAARSAARASTSLAHPSRFALTSGRSCSAARGVFYQAGKAGWSSFSSICFRYLAGSRRKRQRSTRDCRRFSKSPRTFRHASGSAGASSSPLKARPRVPSPAKHPHRPAEHQARAGGLAAGAAALVMSGRAEQFAPNRCSSAAVPRRRSSGTAPGSSCSVTFRKCSSPRRRSLPGRRPPGRTPDVAPARLCTAAAPPLAVSSRSLPSSWAAWRINRSRPARPATAPPSRSSPLSTIPFNFFSSFGSPWPSWLSPCSAGSAGSPFFPRLSRGFRRRR